MNEKITITKADGTNTVGELVCAIENIATKKRYVYYTLNEIVGTSVNSTVKIYVTEIAQNDPTLDTPISEEDWKMLRDCMGDSIKGNTNPNIKYLPLSELGNITSASERAIAMPISYDYINKQRGIYATAIASGDTAGTPSAQNIEPAPTPVPEAPAPQASVEPAPVAMEPTNLSTSPEPQPFAPGMSGQPQAPVMEPTPTPTPVVPEPTPSIEPVQPEPQLEASGSAPSAELKPIDISEIENKYKEMIESLENLKNNEIEAAKRYNATLELSEMHKVQHATYVQNEQTKETTEPSLSAETTEQSAAPLAGVAPTLGETPGAIEPTPVTPVEPVAPTNIETNWFDMPSNTGA